MATEAVGTLDALAGDAAADATLVEETAAVGVVVAFIGVQLGGPLPAPPVGLRDRRDRGDQRGEEARVGAVGPGDAAGERNAVPIDDEVVFGAGFRAVGRVGAGGLAPLARTLALSTLARDQSMRPAAPRR